MFKLSRRLEAVLAMIPPRKTVADIGCDHAYLAIALAQRGLAPAVLACDVRSGPLNKARENVNSFGVSDRVTLRLGDGLEPVGPGEAEVLVMAGMGGELMMEIVGERIHEFDSCIFSPQSEWARFRRFLHDCGQCIAEERMVEEDGKFYLILRAEAGREHYTDELEYLYGRRLLLCKDIVLRRFLERELARYEDILRQTNKAQLKAAYAHCREALRRYGT